MKLIVVSPECDRADEIGTVEALFSSGLQRYHVRKPHASREQLQTWLQLVPSCWHGRLMLHQHHELVAEYGLAGQHWRDDAGAAVARGHAATPWLTSRSCHELGLLRSLFGVYDSIFFGPIFPSLSKPGYGPRDAQVGEALGAILHTRTHAERRTDVIAIGGITAETAPRAAALGFDGVAVLGAVWQASDPVAAFCELQRICRAAVPPVVAGREPARDGLAEPDRWSCEPARNLQRTNA